MKLRHAKNGDRLFADIAVIERNTIAMERFLPIDIALQIYRVTIAIRTSKDMSLRVARFPVFIKAAKKPQTSFFHTKIKL